MNELDAAAAATFTESVERVVSSTTQSQETLYVTNLSETSVIAQHVTEVPPPVYIEDEMGIHIVCGIKTIGRRGDLALGWFVTSRVYASTSVKYKLETFLLYSSSRSYPTWSE